jgi:hypothetical protein
MQKKREQECLERCLSYLQILQTSIDWASVTRDPLTLVAAMGRWCHCSIAITPMQFQAPITGCLITQHDRYLIGYAPHLPRLLWQHTILHELAHIVRYKLSSPPTPGEIASTLTMLDPNFIEASLFYRCLDAKTDDELETELLADMLRLYIDQRL